MRVRRLELRNYRRHADTRLELPDGVTALVGGNGAGKSTLLEALGFALFGTDALRTSKTLLRHEAAPPADPVSVLVELEVGGQAIAIHRELRGKALTPSATLTIDGAVVVPAGAGSSEAATQLLQRRLGMDQDAFFTTVVARQGELAALASQAPADRKRLILRMLGVDRIDAAVERARERRRDAEATVKALRSTLPDAGLLAQQESAADAEARALVAETAAAQAQLAASSQAAEAARRNLQEIQARAAARQQALNALEATRREHALLARMADDARRAALEAEQAGERAQALASAAADLPTAEADWVVALQRQQTVQHRAQQVAALQRLEREAAQLRARPTPVVPPAPDIRALEAAVLAAQSAADAAGDALSTARAATDAAQARLGHLVHLGDGAPCPTCEQPLGKSATALRGEAEAAARTAAERSASAARDQATARKMLVTARDALAAGQATEQQARLAAAEAASQARALADLDRRVAEARAALSPELPATDLAAAQRRVDAARTATAQRAALLQAAAKAPTLRAAATEGATRLQAGAAAVAAAEAALAAAPDATRDLAAAATAVDAAIRAERAADLAVHAVSARQAAAAQRVLDLAARRTEAQAAAARLAAADVELREWTALADGRNGLLERFRDHVVDRIGPAIQGEASRLLSLFTAGRYPELLLDADYGVYVTDGGVRYSIERFSGGEQDLAHLALRLAVSRLLAERAGGVEMRFLALDEVFGALDEERRGQVVAALHSLSGLYGQVLVVSHLAALNDALDQAIAVELVDGNARLSLRNG